MPRKFFNKCNLGPLYISACNNVFIFRKLKIHGVPVKWKSLITNWQQTAEFTDLQLKGPYAKWYHRHLFKSIAGGVLIEDKVAYRLPLSRFGNNILHWLILKDIKNIFSYSSERIEKWR